MTKNEIAQLLPLITVAAVDDLGDLEPGTTYTFRLPKWLAQDRGLI